MDERRPASEPREGDAERRDGEPPQRPITEWPKEAEERGDADETPGVGQPPG